MKGNARRSPEPNVARLSAASEFVRTKLQSGSFVVLNKMTWREDDSILYFATLYSPFHGRINRRLAIQIDTLGTLIERGEAVLTSIELGSAFGDLARFVYRAATHLGLDGNSL